MATPGEKIKNKREELGHTLDFVSKATNVPIATISRIENGLIKRPSEEHIRLLTDFLKLNFDDIYNYRSSEHVKPPPKSIRIGFPVGLHSALIPIYLQNTLNPSYERSLVWSGKYLPDSEVDADDATVKSNFHSMVELEKEAGLERKLVSLFSAKHLAQKLRKDDLDCILIGGEIGETYTDFMPVSKIYENAEGGCSLLMIHNEPEEFKNKNVQPDLSACIMKARAKEEEAIFELITACADDIVLNDYQNHILFSIISESIKTISVQFRNDPFINQVAYDIRQLSEQPKLAIDLKAIYCKHASEGDGQKLKEFFKSILQKYLNLQIYFPESTIGRFYYDRYIRDRHIKELSPNNITTEIARNWDAYIKKIIFPFNDQHGEVYEFNRNVLFLCWEPIFTYFKKAIDNIRVNKLRQGMTKLREINYHEFPIPNEQMYWQRDHHYSSFAIYFKKGSELLYSDTLMEFLNDLSKAVKVINSALRSVKAKEDEINRKIKDANDYIKELASLRDLNLNGIESNKIEASVAAHFKNIAEYELELNLHISENQTLKLLSTFYDIPAKDCYDSIKSYNFDIEVDYSWFYEFYQKKLKE